MKLVNNTFSEAVTEYIISKIPPYIGLAMIQLDENGLIKSWVGPVEKYFVQQPKKGKHLEEIAPYLFGMVPPLVNPMVLPHIQTDTGHYAEIHLLEDELMHTWLFFVDQTRTAVQIQKLLQTINDEKLKIARARQTNKFMGPFNAFYLLDYASFIKEKEQYLAIGKMPVWFKELKNAPQIEQLDFDLINLFPFIEVFQYEAVDCWEGPVDAKLESGIWEEETITGRLIYLQAIAVKHAQVNYLLIKPANKNGREGNELIQKAREQRLTLDQLARTEKQLKKLLSFKDQFVSIVSHDLRSPIGAVIGLSEILLSDENLKQKMDEGQKELLSDINEEMRRLLDYNDKLYNWSNLELGNFKLSLIKTDLKELAEYVERMQHLKMQAKKISFTFEYDSATLKDFELHADEVMLGQALNNLVGNSVKFTPEGGKITMGLEKSKLGYHLFIADNGVGMPEEVSKKLFKDFTNKSTMGTYGERGTGLGLGIVKKIVEAHGWTIHVESAPGQGSKFIIRIK